MWIAYPVVPLTCLLALTPVLAGAAPNVTAQKPDVSQSRGAVDLSAPLTLDRALSIALANQQSLAIASSQWRSSKAQVTVSRSSYFPQITPSYEYINQRQVVNTGAGRSTVTGESGTTQVNLQQLIFDTGKREATLRQSLDSLHAAELGVVDERQTVIYNVTYAFYELLRTKELVRVSDASVTRARATFDSTKAAAEAGTTRAIDVLQAESELDNALVDLSQARNNVRVAQVTLKNAMGIITPIQIVTADVSLADPSPQPDAKPVAEYVQMAFDTRPSLKQSKALVDADRGSLKIANIEAGLQVQASLAEGYQVDPDPGENRSFVTTFTYPLFDAGAARAKVQQAREQVDQASRQVELARQAVQLEVEQAFLVREEARERVAATRVAVDAARKNYEAARAAQQEGQGDIIEVITAQTSLVTAETNAVQALYDYYSADARLARALGTNDANQRGGPKH